MNFELLQADMFSKLNTYQAQEKTICTTSSFQTQSVPLLHILSKFEKKIPVLFIDTGFHFPETYQFMMELRDRFNLEIVKVYSSVEKSFQLDTNGAFLYNSSPDYCCQINKVEPLNRKLNDYDVWVAGVRKDQTTHRSLLDEEVAVNQGLIKFQPMLDWNSKMVYEYIRKNKLPKHPLEEKGYFSVGCMPCTVNTSNDAQRNGRWFGMNKKECGIHINNS